MSLNDTIKESTLNENAKAMDLIKTFDVNTKGDRGRFIAAAVKMGMKATSAGAYWQRNKKYAISGGSKSAGSPEGVQISRDLINMIRNIDALNVLRDATPTARLSIIERKSTTVGGVSITLKDGIRLFVEFTRAGKVEYTRVSPEKRALSNRTIGAKAKESFVLFAIQALTRITNKNTNRDAERLIAWLNDNMDKFTFNNKGGSSEPKPTSTQGIVQKAIEDCTQGRPRYGTGAGVIYHTRQGNSPGTMFGIYDRYKLSGDNSLKYGIIISKHGYVQDVTGGPSKSPEVYKLTSLADINKTTKLVNAVYANIKDDVSNKDYMEILDLLEYHRKQIVGTSNKKPSAVEKVSNIRSRIRSVQDDVRSLLNVRSELDKLIKDDHIVISNSDFYPREASKNLQKFLDMLERLEKDIQSGQTSIK